MVSSATVRILCVAGTRPEAIKLAPILLAAAERPNLDCRLCATGQHDALFDEALRDFGLSPDVRLAAPPHDPSPDVMVSRFADTIEPMLMDERPDIVLVQGDTNSAYAGALAAYRLGIPIGHVEAGLRSHDIALPWPEERNRVMIDRLADLLFAPTPESAANIEFERDVVKGRCLITGNTGIDALLTMRSRLLVGGPVKGRRLILLTCHRRESIGSGIEAICAAALRLADRGDVDILCPVHPNPAVAETVHNFLGRHSAISLTGALPYRDAVMAMVRAHVILTDSGGVQEEAPALGTPVLVLREVTERPEGIASGNLLLVGTDPDRIVAETNRLLDEPALHAAMARPAFPFGLGDASAKILDAIEQYFSSAPSDDHPLPFARTWIMDSAR
ncbi:non-hydrolyzing UDP-N-acetylglucosamine 2-epimerase [Sphingomonas oryzagri]